ncbi:MAG: hypothetical protein CVT97_08665 [Bacteroidetes bacterium HGW-Bacteroidetes-14]|jgi:hypothetical protein|nr:MAG: hypothetical protein CVT97_08665 [Bacteroidetes bacterium HGW-Bacteroidetes-14]
MKTKKGTLSVVKSVSPLFCNFRDEAGNGIVGFTVTYADGSFKNFTRAFCPETQAAVQSEIATIREIMKNSLDTLEASKQINNENRTKSKRRNRRLL